MNRPAGGHALSDHCMGWSCRSDVVNSKRGPKIIYAGNLQYLQRKLSPDLKKFVLILAAAATPIPTRAVDNNHSEIIITMSAVTYDGGQRLENGCEKHPVVKVLVATDSLDKYKAYYLEGLLCRRSARRTG